MILLLQLPTWSIASTLNVDIILGSSSEDVEKVQSKIASQELHRLFEQHRLGTFYLLGRHQLHFLEDEKSPVQSVELPNGQRALFRPVSLSEQTHTYQFHLPDYGIELTLRAPVDQIFYQAGIKHEQGVIILRLTAKK